MHVVVIDSGTIPIDDEIISDHKATHACLLIPFCLWKSYYREVLNFKNANFNHSNDLIRQHDWDSEINETLSIDQSCKNFTNTFLQCL